MDALAAGLRDRIQATLDANAAIRQAAELDLRRAEEQPGFTDTLLSILEAEQDPGVRLSTAIYIKNRVSKGWSPNDDFSQAKPILEQEKASFRNRLVPVLVAAPPQVRSQLVPALQKILGFDFPEKWSDFIEIVAQLLNAQDISSVSAGVLCMLAICKTYRFRNTDKRPEFNKIAAHTFPQLLNIGNSLVNENSIEAGELLRTVLKVYKHAIFFDLPPALREQQTMVGWCTLFLGVVSKDPPECSLPEDVEDRETNHWWKARKWAYANLNRLFIRYGNPQSIGKSQEAEYQEMAKYFISHFAPEILKVYLAQIEKWVSKTLWLNKASLYHTLTFLDECIKPKSMWDLLKPHTDSLIEHLVFPVLCQTDKDLETFDDDPQEYLQRKLNFYDEGTAPDVAATNFLVTLTKSRRKQTFNVLNFINGVVNAYEAAPDNEKDPRRKEGALRMIGTLSGVILGKKSPIADQVEYFFVRHVFPEFRSPHGFLRARACDTLEKFEQLDFNDPNNLILIYRNILESMADPALPVRVAASLALQPLIRHDIIRQNMKQNIPQVMQQLLKLANEVDVDALANVMEDFVEVFAPELTPFAVALSEQLRDTYLRIVGELLSRNTNNDDAEYGDFLDEKSITALGVLQTIGTLILTLESTPDVLHHLETTLMPVITITLENKLYDLYNEVFEIIDSCTFSAKAISPTMWEAFKLIHRTFQAGAELYLEDMLPALENYVNYGAETLIHNREYLDAIMGMIRTIFQDDKVAGVDRICGCKLAEIVMLSLRGHVDDLVPEFIVLASTVLFDDHPKVKSLKIHLMEVVINAIYYNPMLALHVLETNGLTSKLFNLWFTSIESFTRVHDKKLCISAICALLTLDGQSVPPSVQQGWPRLLQGIVRLFQTLPAAEKNREEAKKEENYDFGEYDDEDDEEWEQQDTEWSNEPEELEDIKDESQAYLEFLNEEAQKFNVGDDDDDDLEEEGLLETPLDKIEPYSMFKHALFLLQQGQPQLYENLLKQLRPEEQQVLQEAVHHADEIVAQTQAGAAQPNGAAPAA
ncbi:ARM repeat-containing protein [Sporormia fimetaria CBS 119925]|uniref:ARM repeat-containing protein n=1 Tax=Sporormia fimetaria CBS 119925 TaxID=1340428 RepID=A0A6A6VC56_9PLEO|nr:ARM repeat-containing protein [Sporormia fimetaria CBS 119925]